MGFYDDRFLGNLFGVKGPMYGPKGHLGVDFVHPAGTSINAWQAGEAIARGTSKTLGNYLIVRTAIGFTDYCHMLTPAFTPVGASVGLGDIIGRVGSTGTLATGPHLHTTLSDSAVLGGQDVHDPLPHIRASISTAGGNVSPLNPQEGDSDMRAVRQLGVPNSGIIIQDGVPPYSLGDQVYEALCNAYNLTSHEIPDWMYGTVVREQWTAFNTADAFRAKATVEADAVAEIVAGVRDALPKSYTVTASPS